MLITPLPARGLCLLPTGKRGKNGLLVRAYAAYDQSDRTPKQVEALYRKRSAIKTSFRTFREARAKTTTRDPTVRLLFVLVGFLLRNLWLVVCWGVLARPRRSGRELPTWFRFEVFREWIAHDLDEDLERRWEAPTNGVGIPNAYRLLDAAESSSDHPIEERLLRSADAFPEPLGALTPVSAPQTGVSGSDLTPTRNGSNLIYSATPTWWELPMIELPSRACSRHRPGMGW